MHDEGPDHAHHFLHRQVRMVEERACLVEREVVNKATARRNRILTGSRSAVHVVWDLEPVPVHGGGFGKVVIHDDPHPVSLVHLDRRPGNAAVIAPEVYDLAWDQLLLHRLGDEVKLLRTTDHSPGKLGNIRSFNQHSLAATFGTMAFVSHVHGIVGVLLGNEQARCCR